MQIQTNGGARKLRVEPKLWRGNWIVDLRSLGHGQRYVLGPEALAREEAIHRAYAKLADLSRGAADLPEQTDLFADHAPALFGSVLDLWQSTKKTRSGTEGAARYLATYARLVRSDLGAYRLADFAPPHGSRRLAAYVAELERRELSGRTIRNRLCVAEQVLRFAFERAWLAQLPLHPRMPPKAAPVFRWLSEAMFRALRAELFRGAKRSDMSRCPDVTDEASFRLHVERRRVYLSWLFYTGAHAYDADHATADWLFLDGRAYIRHNHKSARCIRPWQFEMPEPLYLDLLALVEFQGRPFRLGEPFAGGPWPEGSRTMQAAARRLGFADGCSPAILRRSYAREMFLHGYTVREVADRMGHADERMLTEIYTQSPRPAGRVQTRWAAPAAGGDGGRSLARVLQMDRS
jgi:integrase